MTMCAKPIDEKVLKKKFEWYNVPTVIFIERMQRKGVFGEQK
ncbi:unnamed protein product [marine sediment metagenome]|uniref:Uncharacterized protein n=1 Tax=marine sediment metagenome TaxID=412755 RepID=X1KF37_9ZZZZ